MNMAGSVSEVAKDLIRTNAVSIPQNVPTEQQEKLLEALTVMQGSIWDYSDSQPWFLIGLRKNNPQGTRQVLESIIHFHPGPDTDASRPHEKRRGTVTISDGEDMASHYDSQGHRLPTPSPSPLCQEEEERLQKEAKVTLLSQSAAEGQRNAIPMTFAEELFTNHKRFSGSPETKIVIKKTVELIGEMNKSCELVFHALRASTRFLTYPTPSVPSDNFILGHLKGWLWLIYKGLSHFGFDQTDKTGLDFCLKTFRREMSFLAREAGGCMEDLNLYRADLKKLNLVIRKEAKLLKKKNRSVWQSPMDRYFRFVDDIKTKTHLLVDTQEDRFFPTDWIFEPHPSETKLRWDFFHFQWVDLKRDWIDCEFEVRSDYSLHWMPYSSFPPHLQTEIVVHLIQHAKALMEECRHFHKINLPLSFDSQEIKFLKFAVQEITKLKRHRDSVEYITGIAKKLFEDLAVLDRLYEEYMMNMEWIVGIIEPCYYTMDRWLADDLILPLEFPTRRATHRDWLLFCGECFRRNKDFLELFGESLQVVLLRSPISIEQQQRFFPANQCLPREEVLPSFAINSFGVSEGYTSSLFDAGLGRDAPLPIHHPLPKYKRRREQTYNIFDIHRLIESTIDCLVAHSPDKIESSPQHGVGGGMDVDIEKYLVLIGEVQRFLAVYSSIFNFMMVDLKERVEVLESLIYSNLPEHYDTLVNMLLYESGKPMEFSSDKSGVKAFDRLSKIFQFVVHFLGKVVPLEDGDQTYYSAKWAYYKSYAKVQSWIYQKASIFAMYNLPSKQDMFASLFSDGERASGVDRFIAEFLDHGRRLIDICENIFKGCNITIQ